MFYRVKVNKKRCISCGICYTILPEVFDFDDEGLAENKLDNNLAELSVNNSFVTRLLEANNTCPTSAIHVTKDKNK